MLRATPAVGSRLTIRQSGRRSHFPSHLHRVPPFLGLHTIMATGSPSPSRFNKIAIYAGNLRYNPF